MNKLDVSFAVGNGLGVSIASMGQVSYQKAFRQVRSDVTNSSSPSAIISGVTFPLMMAIVNVHQGAVVVRIYFMYY